MMKSAILGAAVFCMLAFTAQAAEENPTPPPGQTETTQATPPATGPVTPPPAEDKKPEQPATPGDGTTQAEPKDDEVVCKRVETASGSRIGTKRVCLTVREWRDYKEEK